MARIRNMLTYANVMATIAVFIALGGGAYAAINLPKNSVGSKQIKANAVDSSKVKNNSLLKNDFKPGQLPVGALGPQGPQGPQGAKGETGAQGIQGTQGAKGETGAKGDKGDPGRDGLAVRSRIRQTASVTSGAGQANATQMSLTGDTWPVSENDFELIFPGDLPVGPPSACTGSDPALHVDLVETANPLGPTTVASWVVPYGTNHAPQLAKLDFRTVDTTIIGQAWTANADVQVWDTCTGPNERWIVGGSGFWFGAVVLGAV